MKLHLHGFGANMARSEIATIYKSTTEIKYPPVQPYIIDQDQYAQASLAGKAKQRAILAVNFVARQIDQDAVENSGPIDSFTLMIGDDDKAVFPYGHTVKAPDNEAQALQKAVNAALNSGFVADTKSLSMFANGKIERLILSK